MFKTSHVTKLTPWTVVEEADAMPVLSYPLLVGSGRLTVGVDATGLQALSDRLCDTAGCHAIPLQTTQADLYVLHEGLISRHLYQDEVQYRGRDLGPGEYCYGQRFNYLPLGYLTQSFTVGGRTFAGDDIPGATRVWRRELDLERAVVTTSYLMDRRVPVSVTVFAPHGGEAVYVRLHREAVPGGRGEFRWQVRLALTTRHGLPIFDQPDAVQPGKRTLLARIDRRSAYRPNEPYAVVYGIAAAGMQVRLGPDGRTATMSGRLDREQTAGLRLDFRRLAGRRCARARSHKTSG